MSSKTDATLVPSDAEPLKTEDHNAVSVFSRLPSVDALLSRAPLREAESRLGHKRLLQLTRGVLDDARQQLRANPGIELSMEALEKQILTRAEAAARPSLLPVINATGVVLHTNLGRAPLAPAAIQRMIDVASQYSNLEYDLERGERGKRDAHTSRLFADLFGAPATLVVNNNAAAVFLALNTLAEGGEVLVSRGEAVEIGGSFRIPEICARSGATLRDIGSTNRTRIGDYAAAINERTRAILRVHPSNFRLEGFAEKPTLEELAELAARHKIALIEDLGSGCLVDLSPLGFHDEPTVAASLAAGVDVITFSGDKLLGGPQAGILLGKPEPLARIRKNPLFRALRVDKLTLSALQATLELYLRGELDAIPVQRMIHASLEQITARTEQFAQRLSHLSELTLSVIDGESVAGGGSTPGRSLPTKLLALRHPKDNATLLAARLRQNRPPVIARVERDLLLLDLRTVFEEQMEALLLALQRLH